MGYLMADKELQNKTLACFDEFFEIQSLRAEAYSRFEESFRKYVECPQGQNDYNYRSMMMRLTSEFSNLSNRVKELQKDFENMGRLKESELLRRLQNSEREKLELTLTLQALRTALATHDSRSSEIEDHAAIGGNCGNADSIHCHSEEISTIHADDLKSAIAENYKVMERCVIQINDILEELREIKGDLLDA